MTPYVDLTKLVPRPPISLKTVRIYPKSDEHTYEVKVLC